MSCRSIFDIDNIDIGPERRAYLETKLERQWEINSEGSIPWVPYLRAPYFVWLGKPWADTAKQAHHEQKVEAPALFPPTFLYTQSWEDPEPDMKVRLLCFTMYKLTKIRVFGCQQFFDKAEVAAG
jgi:betaine lipid synthase